MTTTYDFRKTASMKPLYGYDGPTTAFMIDDYPSGFTARCMKKVWLEFKPKQGWRLVEQTSEKFYPQEGDAKRDPRALMWNKPKASTYALVAACMYLDDQDFVQWSQLGFSADPEKCKNFLENFPQADKSGIKGFAAYNLNDIYKRFKGAIVMMMDGKPVSVSDHEFDDMRKRMSGWAEVYKMVGGTVTPDMQNVIEGKVDPKKVDPEEFAKNRQEQLKEKAETAAKAPGAMTCQAFADELKEKLSHLPLVKDRGFKVEASPDVGGVYINYYNLPKERIKERRGGGAEASNNHVAMVVEGWPRQRGAEEAIPAAKVKFETRVVSMGRDDRDAKIRGKSDNPEKMIKYLCDSLARVAKDYEPRYTHNTQAENDAFKA